MEQARSLPIAPISEVCALAGSAKIAAAQFRARNSSRHSTHLPVFAPLDPHLFMGLPVLPGVNPDIKSHELQGKPHH
jgi:hypothetical protein